MADNPTLIRLRELEILEKVAASSKLNILLGNKGLTDRVTNVLQTRSPEGWTEVRPSGPCKADK